MPAIFVLDPSLPAVHGRFTNQTTGTSYAVNAVEMSGLAAGIYQISDAAIAAAAVPAGLYIVRTFDDTAANDGVNNLDLESEAEFSFDGTIEVDMTQAIVIQNETVTLREG